MWLIFLKAHSTNSEEMKFWREWHIIGLFCEDKVSLGGGSKGSKPGMEIVPGETDGG